MAALCFDYKDESYVVEYSFHKGYMETCRVFQMSSASFDFEKDRGSVWGFAESLVALQMNLALSPNNLHWPTMKSTMRNKVWIND